MAQPIPFYVLTQADWDELSSLLGEMDLDFATGLLDDFEEGTGQFDGYWFGNWSNMTQEERDFLDENIIFDMRSYTASQMAAMVGP